MAVTVRFLRGGRKADVAWTVDCQVVQSFVADNSWIMVIARFVPSKRDCLRTLPYHTASEFTKIPVRGSLRHDKRGLKASFFLIRTALAVLALYEIAWKMYEGLRKSWFEEDFGR